MSTPSNQSFVTLPSSVVIEACERTIAAIVAERRKRDKKWIEDHRGNIRKYSFFGLFTFGPIIRKETDEEVMHDLSFESAWEAHSHYAWGTLDTAEKLLNAARMTTEVNVTIEDWEEVT